MDTDTPRTDEAISLHYSEGDYFGEETTKEAYEFARKLERELNDFAELIADIEEIVNNVANCSTDSQAADDCATICQMIYDNTRTKENSTPSNQSERTS